MGNNCCTPQNDVGNPITEVNTGGPTMREHSVNPALKKQTKKVKTIPLKNPNWIQRNGLSNSPQLLQKSNYGIDLEYSYDLKTNLLTI